MCAPIENVSIMQSFSYFTITEINSFHVTEKNLLLIILLINPIKTHGSGNLSIKIINDLDLLSITIHLKKCFEWSLQGSYGQFKIKFHDSSLT